MPQSRLSKFGQAHRQYWGQVEAALRDKYHRDPDTAMRWATDEKNKLEAEQGCPIIPDTSPARLAQEIFMERIEI